MISSTGSFHYEGDLFASKSVVNRLLCVQSHFPGLEIVGTSDADDVRHMQQALLRLRHWRSQSSAGTLELDCGEAGTVLRFLALRCSRIHGQFRLLGSARLFSRPVAELVALLSKLGVSARVDGDSLRIEGEGWKPPDVLEVDCSESTQFASGLLLNAWSLGHSLDLRLKNLHLSRGYWDMTLDLVRRLGMSVSEDGVRCLVGAGSTVSEARFRAEMDMDAAFVVAALAVVSGSARLASFPRTPLQPDGRFPQLLRRMEAPVHSRDGDLVVRRAETMRPLTLDMHEVPDLFPVLAVLCALAEGDSHLHGARHLRDKESDRLANTARLLTMLGVACEERPAGLVIHGEGRRIQARWARAHAELFDPDQDHRMAMAAGVARCAGARIDVSEPDVVDKSFPRFWSLFESVKAT